MISILFVTGCGSKPQDSSIDLKRRDIVSIFDFIDRVDVIQLETNKESLINRISQVISYEDQYYIFDSREQAVFCFSKTGRFRYKIHSVGRGPEEYTYLEHFNIDPYNRRIILSDVVTSTILYYDLDGNFIEKRRLPSENRAYNDVYVVNRDTLLFASAGEFNFIYYSLSENRIIKRLFPVENEKRRLLLMGRVYRYQDSLFFYTPLSENETYNLSSNDLSIDYKWNFGESNYKKDNIKRLYDEVEIFKTNFKPYRFVDFIGEGKYLDYFIAHNVETNRYRIASLRVDDSNYISVLYDKNRGSHYVFDKTTEGIQIIFRHAMNDETIVLLNYDSPEYKFYDMEILTKEQRQIIDEHNEESDNPFLVIYHLKQ